MPSAPPTSALTVYLINETTVGLTNGGATAPNRRSSAQYRYDVTPSYASLSAVTAGLERRRDLPRNMNLLILDVNTTIRSLWQEVPIFYPKIMTTVPCIRNFFVDA